MNHSKFWRGEKAIYNQKGLDGNSEEDIVATQLLYCNFSSKVSQRW